MGTFHHSVSQQNAKQFFTDTIFETGAYFFPIKLQNRNCFQSRGVRLVPNGYILTCFASGALCLDAVNESHAR